MEKIKATNAILIKAKKRHEASKFAKQYTIDKPYEKGYIFKGLFRTGQHWLVQKGKEYFIDPINQMPKSKPTPTKGTPSIRLVQIADLNYCAAATQRRSCRACPVPSR